MHSKMGQQSMLIDEFFATIAVLADVSIVVTSMSSRFLSGAADKITIGNGALEGTFHVSDSEMVIEILFVLEWLRTLWAKPTGQLFVVGLHVLAQFFVGLKRTGTLRSGTSK